MLNKTEKEGCRGILNILSYTDILSVADTVTKKQIKVTSKTEAVRAILTYTENPVELFKRKKIKRDVLFQYLAEQKVVVPVNADKRALMVRILKHWGTDIDLTDMDVEEYEDVSQSSSASSQTDYPSRASASTDTGVQASKSAGTQAILPHVQNGVPLQPGLAKGNHHQQPLINVHVQQYYNVTNVNGLPHLQTGSQNVVNSQTASMPQSQTVNIASDSHFTNSELQTLGEKFAKWFFEIINSHNPSTQSSPQDFGPHHFWDDTYLLLTIHTPGPSVEKFIGPIPVSQRFLAFTKEEQLLFNANISREGVCVRSTPHGLVMILVCGTIHRANDCLGIFQQVFGIIKDPRYDNNYKIKMTKLDVKSSQVMTMPKLEGDIESQINALIPVQDR